MFKYIYDAPQQAALNYKAVCTPDIHLFDKDLELFYQHVNPHSFLSLPYLPGDIYLFFD